MNSYVSNSLDLEVFVKTELTGTEMHLVSGTIFQDRVTIISNKIIELEDEAIREVLYKLGWRNVNDYVI